jgi:hypothetical protein
MASMYIRLRLMTRASISLFAEGKDRYHDIQVKSIRGLNYIFFRKEYFELRENLYAAIVVFDAGESPKLFLVPATVWLKPDALFVSRDYGPPKKSKPEWGIFLSPKTYHVKQSIIPIVAVRHSVRI